MSTPICEFVGDYRFLSNFWPVIVTLDGRQYSTVEHAYQAAKTLNPLQREYIREAPTPGNAKRRGRSIDLRTDWEEIKLTVMLALLRQKFDRPDLREALLQTGDAELIEGNTWGDCFWGVCRGKGRNHLGRLLMQVRSEIQR
jgi:ribA/ribD-fused uncharacterized protein